MTIPCGHRWPEDGRTCHAAPGDHVHQPARTCQNGKAGKARHHAYTPDIGVVRRVVDEALGALQLVRP